MGRKSTRENKNIYQVKREEMELTREQASDLMEYISSDRLEKIESEKSLPHPDEILIMADAYKSPSLCNYYCSHECPIGQKYVPEVATKELSQITLEMLATLNSLQRHKDRLIEITVDGVISDDEVADFAKIRAELDKMSLSIESLKLWIDTSIASGTIDSEALKKCLEN